MDKRVIFAVAGSGKTTYIVNQINLDKRSLVITYTINNKRNLQEAIIEKFGYFPDNIRLLSYFSFLYKFCYRPLLSYKFPTSGINYNKNPNRFVKQTALNKYFFDRDRRVYSNRIAKLLDTQEVLDDVNNRLSKYFDNLFIDEVQDFAGHDFNFLRSTCKANLEMAFVGDFYQHTFDTSRDGNVNRNLHVDYDQYQNFFVDMGMAIDTECLKKSHRCSPTICNFITENIGIEIYSNRIDETNVVFIEDSELAEDVFRSESIVKLFYQEHYKYGCYSRNWGDSKGENKYHDVCVVLNKTSFNKFKKNALYDLPPQTKNKMYVACSRSRNDLYIVSDAFYKKLKS